MREWLRPSRDTETEAKPQPRRQSFFEGIAEFVRDEAIDHVVDKASGGWLSYEGSDEEDDAPRRTAPPADSFNDRIERALAELRAQEQVTPAPTPESTTAAPAPAPAPASPMPVAVIPPVAVRTFGRKPV